LRVVYVPDPIPQSMFVITADDLVCKPLAAYSAEGRESEAGQIFLGRDEERVLAHYEEQTEADAVAEDEAALDDQTQTVMKIPTELVLAVRELIAHYRR